MSKELRDPYALDPSEIRQPPASLREALREIGPGIILAGSIVGTGELIATTDLGAKVGFVLLWLVIFSCFIKVFVQIELGRYAIASGKTTLEAFHSVPTVGKLLVIWWLVMMLMTLFQLGAMVDGVAQAFGQLTPAVTERLGGFVQQSGLFVDDATRAQTLPWAVVTTVLAIALLVTGSYRIVQNVSLVLVCFFTFMTITCVVALPWAHEGFSFARLLEGFTFRITSDSWREAMTMFGITGVGASELISYPYWCIEKGYARWTGPPDGSAGWFERARGWLRVMRLDAWGSMVIYTTATVAFYVLGAGVLFDVFGGQGLGEGSRLVPSLIAMYTPVLGEFWARVLFVVGAIAVLFSTLFVSSAANARLTTDFLYVMGVYPRSDHRHRLMLIRAFCFVFPAIAFLLYVLVGKPVFMVQLGGLAQSVTLPMIAAVAVYFRLRRVPSGLRPTRLWDVGLVASALALGAAGAFTGWKLLFG